MINTAMHGMNELDICEWMGDGDDISRVQAVR